MEKNQLIQENMKGQPVRMFWMRRDLRLNDSHGLAKCLEASKNDGIPTLILFIFDTQILSKLKRDDSRVSFIHDQIIDINTQLLSVESSVLAIHGEPLSVFKKLSSEFQITEVYTNHDYESAALQRDFAVSNLLSELGIAFFTFKDQVIFERNEVVKDDGKPYTVYTPYKKKWLAHFDQNPPTKYSSEELLSFLIKSSYPLPTIDDMGFKNSKIEAPPLQVSKSLIESYDKTRDFPSVKGTSHLGLHLRFGTLSVRELVAFALKHNAVFLSELIWREFFMQIIFNFPHSENENFKKEFDRIKWRNSEVEFEKWKKGQTGYPIVDAGMRELVATGYMHNRVRMIAASFLCKHLLIDWKWGERFFAEHLFDYELASNVGNWQWVAGTGCDAAPYFRVFNPEIQNKKFDSKNTYVKKWVPEFGTSKQLSPMVDHKTARVRALRAYKG